MKDPYAVLGISSDASEDEIKVVYRRLAHQYHPDKGGGDISKFKEVQEAYSALMAGNRQNQEFAFNGFDVQEVDVRDFFPGGFTVDFGNTTPTQFTQEKPTGPVCPQCGGTGRQQFAQSSPFGTFKVIRACPTCKGAGRMRG